MNKTRSIKAASIEELHAEISHRVKLDYTKQLIFMIGAASAITVGAVVAPKLTSFICSRLKKITKNRGYMDQKKSVRRALSHLRDLRLINWHENTDGQITLTLTKSGKKRLLRYKLEELSIKPQDHWDRIWRIVIFDIPETAKIARNALRDKFRTLGLYQLQKSAWIYPYPCKNEVDFISSVYGVGRYLLFFEVQQLENEKYLRDKFNVSG